MTWKTKGRRKKKQVDQPFDPGLFPPWVTKTDES